MIQQAAAAGANCRTERDGCCVPPGVAPCCCPLLLPSAGLVSVLSFSLSMPLALGPQLRRPSLEIQRGAGGCLVRQWGGGEEGGWAGSLQLAICNNSSAQTVQPCCCLTLIYTAELPSLTRPALIHLPACPPCPPCLPVLQIYYHYTRDRSILHKALLRRNLGPAAPLAPATGLLDPALQSFHEATMAAVAQKAAAAGGAQPSYCTAATTPAVLTSAASPEPSAVTAA